MTLMDIVSSRRKAAVLRLLFGLEPREYHLRDLARHSDLALGTIQQELARLVKAGLITLRRDGNRVYYKANAQNPVYDDVRNVVLKTSGLADILRAALQDRRVDLAFVFGSLARDSAKPHSDVDLMVVGSIGLRRLASLLSGAGKKLGREINPHAFVREEFARRRRAGDHFILSVLASPRLFIIGSENELAELGK